MNNNSRVPDPVNGFGRLVFGFYFLLLALSTFYSLVVTWPVLNGTQVRDFSFLCWGPFSIPADLRLFMTVIAAGALGSLIHTITSFADYVGNRNLGRSWLWWLVLRTPVGIALALLFYLVLRGGLIVPSLPDGGGSGTDTAHLLNPYGIAAISALAGMFSKQATDKLREIFDTLFRTREPVARADPLVPTKPIVTSTNPSRLSVGSKDLQVKVTGRGFRADSTANVNGAARLTKLVSQMELAVVLLPSDVTAPGTLQLTVSNPGSEGGNSDPVAIEVQAPVAISTSQVAPNGRRPATEWSE